MTAKLKLSTQEAIAEAGFRVFSRNPGANLAEVAELAGTTRATLHRYYPSRQVLVDELARRAIQEMDAAVQLACADSRTAGEALQYTLAALIPLGDRHGFLAHEQIDLGEHFEQDFLRIQAETAQWVEAARLEGVFARDVPTEWITRTYSYLLYAAWESVREEEATPKQAATLAWRTLTSGLGGSDDKH